MQLLTSNIAMDFEFADRRLLPRSPGANQTTTSFHWTI